MKMKSAVLASALVAVSSVFATSLYDSDVIYTNWYEVVSAEAVSFTEENPVFLSGDAITATQDGYVVTADVSVVIHASLPSVPTNITVNTDEINPKGSICAADVNGTAKWYGLDNNRWVELTLPDGTTFATPGATTYTLVTEFDDYADGGQKVRYSVISNNTTQTSGWYTSGHTNVLQKVGLAGTGSYTKVVGLLVNAWTETIAGVPISVDKTLLASMCQALSIPTANTTPAAIEAALKAPAANGIAKWANYVLGINGDVAANKPFAAPVQNSTASTLTFKLGGVSARTEVADVKYAIETLDSPDGDVKATSTAVAAGTDQTITLDSSAVKYYRVKVQIDAKSN